MLIDFVSKGKDEKRFNFSRMIYISFPIYDILTLPGRETDR